MAVDSLAKVSSRSLIGGLPAGRIVVQHHLHRVSLTSTDRRRLSSAESENRGKLDRPRPRGVFKRLFPSEIVDGHNVVDP